MPTDQEVHETVLSLIDGVTTGVPYVQTAYNVLMFLYDFGKSNPIENAFQEVRREIDRIITKLEALESQLDIDTQRIVKAENLARIRLLREQAIRLSALGVQLATFPGDRAQAAVVANEAGARADTFLIDEDLWLWSDVRIVTPRNELGQPVGPRRIYPVEPDYKTTLAMPVYSMALAVWTTAMMIETGSDRATIRARHGAQLDRHIAAVSVTFGWHDDGSGAVTIAEKIRSRITCQPIPVTKYAQNGVCNFTVQCSNTIERTRHIVREFSVEMPDAGAAVLCTINPEVVDLDEREIEDEDAGIRMLSLWEEILKSIDSTGHMPAEPFVGVFPTNEVFLPQVLYLIARNGDLVWRMNHDAARPGGSNRWDGPRTVGTGWDGFKTVFCGGGAAIYGVRPDGALIWHRHDGWQTGTWNWHEPSQQVGYGWQGLREIFSGGEYVVYGIQQDGALIWYRHDGGRYGGGLDTWAGRVPVGTGWAGFQKVMSGGDGIIYTIGTDGVLTRYNHIGYRTGTTEWGYSQKIGTGWAEFKDVVAASDNVFYVFTRDGKVLWYKYKMTRNLLHRPWLPRFFISWEGPVEVSRFVPGFRSAFAFMKGPPEIPH